MIVKVSCVNCANYNMMGIYSNYMKLHLNLQHFMQKANPYLKNRYG